MVDFQISNNYSSEEEITTNDNNWLKFFEGFLEFYVFMYVLLHILDLVIILPSSRVSPNMNLPIQIISNGLDFHLYIDIGIVLDGFSFFGFFLPLGVFVLMVIVFQKKLKIQLDRYYVTLLIGVFFISLFGLYPTGGGISMMKWALVCIFCLSVGVGFIAFWDNLTSRLVLMVSAVWFGQVPADFIAGIIYLPDYVTSQCLGGALFGFGDGLWGTTFIAILCIFLGWYIRNILEIGACIESLENENRQSSGTL